MTAHAGARGGPEFDAFSYFQTLKPIARIGHSILIYRVDEADAARLSRLWERSAVPGMSQWGVGAMMERSGVFEIDRIRSPLYNWLDWQFW